MKRNIDDFDGMKDFIISIVGAVAWFLIGSIVIIGYFTIESEDGSIILSFVSTMFTIISSLGILATIGVYFLQKKNSIASENNRIKRDEEIERNRLDRKRNSVLRVLKIELRLTIDIYEKLNRLTDAVVGQDYDSVAITNGNDHFTFSFIKNKTLIGNIFIPKVSQYRMKELVLKSTDINPKTYNELIYVLEAMEKYHWFLMQVYKLSYVYSIPNSHNDNKMILSKESFDMLMSSGDEKRTSYIQDFAADFIFLSSIDLSYSDKNN